jgi:hypothetical protein
MAIRLCGLEPALGRLSDVLNPHRQMKPIEHMVSRAQFMKFTRANCRVCAFASAGTLANATCFPLSLVTVR